MIVFYIYNLNLGIKNLPPNLTKNPFLSNFYKQVCWRSTLQWWW